METKSIYRYARISPFKVREVTREIQGLSVQRALDLLAFTPKKAAVLVAKTLKSAVANAENNHQSRSELLVVREAVVGEGPTLNRFVPKARGSAGPIRQRPPLRKPNNASWDKKFIQSVFAYPFPKTGVQSGMPRAKILQIICTPT